MGMYIHVASMKAKISSINKNKQHADQSLTLKKLKKKGTVYFVVMRCLLPELRVRFPDTYLTCCPFRHGSNSNKVINCITTKANFLDWIQRKISQLVFSRYTVRFHIASSATKDIVLKTICCGYTLWNHVVSWLTTNESLLYFDLNLKAWRVQGWGCTTM